MVTRRFLCSFSSPSVEDEMGSVCHEKIEQTLLWLGTDMWILDQCWPNHTTPANLLNQTNQITRYRCGISLGNTLTQIKLVGKQVCAKPLNQLLVCPNPAKPKSSQQGLKTAGQIKLMQDFWTIWSRTPAFPPTGCQQKHPSSHVKTN